MLERFLLTQAVKLLLSAKDLCFYCQTTVLDLVQHHRSSNRSSRTTV